MPESNKLVRERLASLPLFDAERDNALRLVSQGESIAEALLALGRLFQHLPAPHPAH